MEGIVRLFLISSSSSYYYWERDGGHDLEFDIDFLRNNFVKDEFFLKKYVVKKQKNVMNSSAKLFY